MDINTPFVGDRRADIVLLMDVIEHTYHSQSRSVTPAAIEMAMIDHASPLVEIARRLGR